jgi:transcription-repair coupling factor (superfamily II helicase)
MYDYFLLQNRRTVVGGAAEGEDARFLAGLAENARALVHIARDDARLASLAQLIGFFAPRLEILTLPAWDCMPYDRISPNADILARRMSCLSRLAQGADTPFILVTTVNAVLQRLPPRANIGPVSFRAEVGQKLDREALRAFLARAGYNRVATVMEPGEYALRGGLADLFPPGDSDPIRLDFFGDVVESIRRFDPLSQRSGAKDTKLCLRPANEILLDQESLMRFRAGYRSLFGPLLANDPLYQALAAGRKHPGMEHWLPLFYGALDTLLDYAPPSAPITLDTEVERLAEDRLTKIADFYHARLDAVSSSLEAPYRPLPPERLYMSANEWRNTLRTRTLGLLTPFLNPQTKDPRIDLEAKAGRDFGPERAQGSDLFAALKAHVLDLQKSKRVMLAALSFGARERLRQLLDDHEIENVKAVESYPEFLALPPATLGLAVLPLGHGFEGADLAVIGEEDLLGERLSRPSRPTRRAEKYLSEARSLSPGDLVVHIEHGVGRFVGLQSIEVGGAAHDCLLLLYDGGDRLYLPVENIEMLSRFGPEEATQSLDRLGGSAWQNRKARIKNRLKDMAEELLKIAAERALNPAPPFQSPNGPFHEFCARFPFDETADQGQAIEDTLADLGRRRPTDRLICGDVGFGKTEIALRAAFVVANAGAQVALICPTTLLARQHFATFSERFHGFPVRIAQLSRLVSAAEAAATKDELAKGSLDIVIGTHALLGTNIAFKNLGLVIVDEEQRFGVRHKEQLKKLHSSVHMLTLTATPIPRTLQMAFSGVRELSLIATPPVDRLAVRSFVMPFDPVVLREALRRELGRGGQAFIVVPRIEDLSSAIAFLAKHVPEAKYQTAHGRMRAAALESAMAAFYDRQVPVLVCTDIVESGLDIPTANTLIVLNADRFGLAQLYQLRGRIGRSKARGYAYYTLAADKPLSLNAERRLRALQAIDTLGAGFHVASYDLDIRGAGNLLGEEQSGHICEVGIELYQDMLQEAIAAARNAAQGTAEAGGGEKWAPQIAVGVSALMPESYVADLSLRLELYRRLADLEEEAEIEAFAVELIDRFGPLPPETQNLLGLVGLKKLCRRASVEKIEAGPRGATVSFRGNRFANPAGLVAFLSGANHGQGGIKLRADHRLVLYRNWAREKDRLAGVRALIRDLASVAEASPQEARAASRPAKSNS